MVLAVGSSPQGTDIEDHVDYDFNFDLGIPRGNYVLSQDQKEISGGPHNIKLKVEDAKQAIKNGVDAYRRSNPGM